MQEIDPGNTLAVSDRVPVQSGGWRDPWGGSGDSAFGSAKAQARPVTGMRRLIGESLPDLVLANLVPWPSWENKTRTNTLPEARVANSAYPADLVPRLRFDAGSWATRCWDSAKDWTSRAGQGGVRSRRHVKYPVRLILNDVLLFFLITSSGNTHSLGGGMKRTAQNPPWALTLAGTILTVLSIQHPTFLPSVLRLRLKDKPPRLGKPAG